MPEHAKQAALEADTALPSHAAPSVVLARASLALGAVEDAAQAFAKAQALDARSLEDPGTMHDFARVLAATGRAKEALATYRALVPRVDLLGTYVQRVQVLLEAAHLSMTLAAPRTSNADGRLDEAIAFLREARQRPPTQLTEDVLLSLVLVLDRAGDRDEAEAILTRVGRTGPRTGGGNLKYVAAPEDSLALSALALEPSDPAAAVRAWEGYLTKVGANGPWVGSAKRRIEALKKGPKRAAPSNDPPKPARRAR